MRVARILPGVATLFQKIFVVGGERGSQILANGEVYDPEKDTWDSLPPMIVPRCEFGEFYTDSSIPIFFCKYSLAILSISGLCAVGGILYAGNLDISTASGFNQLKIISFPPN